MPPRTSRERAPTFLDLTSRCGGPPSRWTDKCPDHAFSAWPFSSAGWERWTAANFLRTRCDRRGHSWVVRGPEMSAVRDRVAALATGRLFLRASDGPRPLPTLHTGGGAATDALGPRQSGLGRPSEDAAPNGVDNLVKPILRPDVPRGGTVVIILGQTRPINWASEPHLL